MTAPIYAIGDIHGCDTMLDAMLDAVTADARLFTVSGTPQLVFLGDYIDRGRGSRVVIDRVMAGFPDFETVCLLGNHEDMMLKCLNSSNPERWEIWLTNGGFETLDSFEFDMGRHGCDPYALEQALGADRIAWLKSLPRHHVIDDYLFVHAGIAPGVPLDEQKPKDLCWIRDRFLDSDADHGYMVVHGHTPVDAPDIRPNRINIDTGAVFGRTLTTVVLTPGAKPRFLTVEA